jgi:hypothetical protein
VCTLIKSSVRTGGMAQAVDRAPALQV